MKSRVSCCNGTILKKDLLRGAPLWGIYLLIWLAILPLNIFSTEWLEGYRAVELIREAAVVNAGAINAMYGLAVACVMYSYLYKARNANFFAGLPVRRETMFLTNYVTGLLYCILPNLAVGLLTVLAGGAVSTNLLPAVCSWIGASFLTYVFYYSFSVLCAVLVGHLVALPVLYGILNFTAVVVEAILLELLRMFVYGMPSFNSLKFQFLSPLFDSLVESRIGVNYERIDDLYQSVEIYGWRYMTILCAVGLGLAVLAFCIYRRRRMEAAGDVIAVKSLRPVFLYCFTAGCSLVIGWLLSALLVQNRYDHRFLPVLLCMIMGAAIGWFGGQMMLRKSLRVFGKGDWGRLGIVCAVICTLLICCKADLFGYTRYVPEAEQVAQVSLRREGGEVEDPELIAAVIDLHQTMVDRRYETMKWRDGLVTAYLRYELKNGKTVCREMGMPLRWDEEAKPEDTLVRYEQIYNDGRFLMANNLPKEYTRESIDYSYLWMDGTQYHLTQAQAYDLLKNGVEKDLMEGKLCTSYWTKRDEAPEETVVEEFASGEMVKVETWARETDFSVHFRTNLPNGGNEYDYRYYDINKDCTNCWRILDSMELVKAE